MPYADREKQRAAQREWYRRKRDTDADFREAEASRVKEWKEDHREELLPKMREYSRKWYRDTEGERRKSARKQSGRKAAKMKATRKA